MSDTAPNVGDWFLIPQAVNRVPPSCPDDVCHRYVVKSSWPGPMVTLLLRSTKDWFDGLEHPAHNGSCGSPTCGLDEAARISLTKFETEPVRLDTYSCAEPDEAVIEWVMAAVPLPPRRRTRRG